MEAAPLGRRAMRHMTKLPEWGIYGGKAIVATLLGTVPTDRRQSAWKGEWEHERQVWAEYVVRTKPSSP